jgi:hypothetical protein
VLIHCWDEYPDHTMQEWIELLTVAQQRATHSYVWVHGGDEQNVQAEAKNVTALVMQLRAAGHPLDEIAVLYPQHRYANHIEEALLMAQVPVQRYGLNTISTTCDTSSVACSFLSQITT